MHFLALILSLLNVTFIRSQAFEEYGRSPVSPKISKCYYPPTHTLYQTDTVVHMHKLTELFPTTTDFTFTTTMVETDTVTSTSHMVPVETQSTTVTETSTVS